MRAIGIILLMGWLASASCQRKEVEPQQQISCDDFVKTLDQAGPLILGRWQWEQTYTYLRGMTAPRVETPQSVGYTEELLFKTGGIVEVYRNGKLTETRKYAIQDVAGETALYLHFTDVNGGSLPTATDMPLLRLCPDRLTLNHTYNDSGGDITYKRI